MSESASALAGSSRTLYKRVRASYQLSHLPATSFVQIHVVEPSWGGPVGSIPTTAIAGKMRPVNARCVWFHCQDANINSRPAVVMGVCRPGGSSWEARECRPRPMSGKHPLRGCPKTHTRLLYTGVTHTRCGRGVKPAGTLDKGDSKTRVGEQAVRHLVEYPVMVSGGRDRWWSCAHDYDFSGTQLMGRVVRGWYKRDGKKSKLTRGVCRDCNLPQQVGSRDWNTTSKPRCVACGGMLDRKGAWKVGVDIQAVLTPGMISPPQSETEFEIQAWLWGELRRLGFNARGCVGTDAGDVMDLVIFDEDDHARCVVETKKGHKANRCARSKNQRQRYELYGVPVVSVCGMASAVEFARNYQHPEHNLL